MKLSSPSFDSRSNAAAEGCLSGILHRFLCGSLRSYGDGEEADEVDAALGQEWRKAEKKATRTPGIVARLMGLESMPVCPCAASESIGRSRSTNSLETWPGFLSERSRCPPVRTSLSFREVPTYLRQENEDFLLLSFAPDDEGETMGSSGMRHGTRFREMKERKREITCVEEKKKKKKRDEHQHRRKKNVPRRRHDEVEDSAVHSPKKNARRKGCRGTKAEDLIKPTKHAEMPKMLRSSSIAKKKLENAREKVESECSSQNSSPVSVLDLACADDDCRINNNSPSSEEEKQTAEQSSRRKLSSNFEDVSCCLSPSIGLVRFSKDGGVRSLDKESKRSRKPEAPCPDFSDVWGNMRRLGEEDLKNSPWISKEMWSSEGVGDIAADLGLEIFDLLLCEVVCEFLNCIAL
ncbi:uncharacterized protein LOC103709513 [Phoenix dactylifera]|uniref:Uncharacterized protein LOC103709513 n=1 Tax=Phoenix dactylifera TaxID=42345 RepID=A0A8B7C720_PHODC|nr:uncharacterized protein LOC103709513 [Phoenix dactylifera]